MYEEIITYVHISYILHTKCIRLPWHVETTVNVETHDEEELCKDDSCDTHHDKMPQIAMTC